MKRILYIIPTLALLGGCAALPTPDQIRTDIGAIQSAVRFGCGLEPTAQQISQIVAANNMGVGSAFDVAQRVCGVLAQ